MDISEEEALAVSEAFQLVGDLSPEFDDTLLELAYDSGVWGKPGSHLTRITFMGKSLIWHEWAVVPIMRVQEELLAEGWQSRYHWEDLQTYCVRKIRGGTNWSMHSGPIAIDINPAKNPMQKTLKTDIPPRVREIFKKHGFFWGGDWKSVKDAMHFEYQGAPVKTAWKPKFPYGTRNLKVTKPLMRGADILWVQKQINILKTYPQNVTQHLKEDGIYGNETANCVGVFQYRYKLTVDKVVGPKTWYEFRKKTNNL